MGTLLWFRSEARSPYTQHAAVQQQQQQRTLKAVTHITIKGGCTHNCEIFAEIFVNGGVNSREIFWWNLTNYIRQEAEQDPERSEGSCEASCWKHL